MEDFYIYMIRVNVALLVFYLLYKMLFARDTFLEIRRLFLLTMSVLAFVYPLISFSSWLDGQQPLQVVMGSYTEMLNIAVTVVAPMEEASVFTWQNGITIIWGMGCLLLLIRLLVQFVVVCRMAFRGKKMICRGKQVIALPWDIAPFSFFGWIFINPDSHEERELSEIIAHEETHVRQWHSLDMMLGELLSILFWFNPIIWFLRKEIRQNLEFLADQNVVNAGYNRKNYQYHLLRLSHQSTAVQIVNNFNVSPLKKRIIMMNKKRTSRIGLLKYALLLPVTGMLILSANAGPLVEMAETTLKEWKMVPDPVMQQKNKVMTGRILDEKGTPLPGATIMVKEKSIGTVSDAEGKFRLEVNEPGTLYFSYVGRKTEMKSFDMTTGELQIELKKDQLFLDKIVVTAYNGKQEEKGEALVVVEEMPEFPFGNVLKYLAKTVKYPAIACENGIEGTVFVSFVVNSQGKVTDAKVVRGVDASLDKEALRVINALPDWKPGKQRGKPVDVQYTLPIEFFIFKPSTKKIQMNKLPADSLVVSKDKHGVIITGTGQPQGKVERKSHEELRDLVRWEGDKKPVYMIDGKRFADLAELNLDDVERISVLLPPSAVKIYGEIAKNGAMVIETKKK